MADYSKWDALAREEEAAERAEKEAKRNANRASYYKAQEEKKIKWDQEQAAKAAAAGSAGTATAAAHGHSHGGGAGHGHSHGGNGSADAAAAAPADPSPGLQPLLSTVRRPACGCGYADVDELKRAAAEAASVPQLSESEKNAKKVAAVHATREHGKQLYTAGQYAEAFAVYERGVLIASGTFNVSPEVQQELLALEVTLDLNMAMCQLKLGNAKGCIDQARMALQLEPGNVKAHYRMAQAHVKLGEYTEARACLQKARDFDEKAGSACKKEIAALLHEIKTLEAAERVKVQQFAKQMEQKLAKQREAFAPTSTTSTTGMKQEEEKDAGAVPATETREETQASNP